MKNLKFYATALCFVIFSGSYGQVQMNKQLQLTGTGSNAEITGIKAVSNNQDATNVDVIQKGGLVYSIDAGSANAYSVTLAPAVTAYTMGMVVNFKAASANTVAATLNVNGIGAKTIKKNYNTDLVANDIQNGQDVSAMWDGANFQMLSQLGNAGGVVITAGTNITVTGTGTAANPYVISSAAPTYTIGLNTALGGYVFYVTPNGQHGLVAETQDQGTDNWYGAQNDISYPTTHNTAGQNFTDWRLPTGYELSEMYGDESAIGGFSAVGYWSSSEGTTYTTAWQQNFSSGSGSDVSKGSYFSIRAVRSF